ncbi:MAG: DMT family transporter [Bacillota bacterium]
MTLLRIQTWQADGLLLAVAAVWGATFPLVKNATDLSAGGVPTYWFLAARFGLATLLLAVVFWRRLRNLPVSTWGAGVLLGLFLFSGYAFQTFGLAYTSSAKAAFITGLAVVIVPVLAVVWLKRKPSPGSWLGVAAATLGLGLLSLNADLIPTYGDLLIFFCAVSFALHVAGVSRYAGKHDSVALAIIQIGTAGLLSGVLHLIDKGTLGPGVANVGWWSGPSHVVLATLICGVLATAAAFLLQNVLQPYTTPTHTALIFSAEPVWGAIFAYLLAGEVLTPRGYLGGALILAGMILAELPIGGRPRAAVAEGD